MVSLLREEGVTPGQRVGLLTLPSTSHLIAWLAVVRVGGIPVVFHTRETAEVQSQLCDTFEIDTVVFDTSLSEVVEQMTTLRTLHTIALRSAASSPQGQAVPPPGLVEVPRDLDSYPPAEVLATPSEDDPAVIVLSSGTTALPKGVVHTHRNLVESARTAFGLYAGLRPGQRVVVPYSTAFTASSAPTSPLAA